MMITKMILCASVLMLGPPQTSEKSSDAKAAQDTQLTSQTQTPEPQPQAAETSDKQQQPSAAKSESEEKEVNGVKLLAIEANIISYTNEERARHGLPPLEVDKELMETAREHCTWMTLNRSIVHTRRPVAENIAMGQPHSSDVVRAWMNSPGHRANILNSGNLKIGVAAYRTAEGTIFWCQQFRR
jgi:uncharacterized protein YkwD